MPCEKIRRIWGNLEFFDSNISSSVNISYESSDFVSFFFLFKDLFIGEGERESTCDWGKGQQERERSRLQAKLDLSKLRS